MKAKLKGISKLKARAREAVESIKFDAYHEMTCEMHCKPVAYILATCSTAKYLIGAVVCSVRGHQWEDDSCVGPESGNMDMYCSRCGESFHHQLY